MLSTRVQDQFYLEAAGEQLRARAILSVVLGSAARSMPRVSALLLATFWKPPPESAFLNRVCVPVLPSRPSYHARGGLVTDLFSSSQVFSS